MIGKGHKSAGPLILLILICTLIGSFIGYILQPYLPAAISKIYTIGAGPFPVDLKFLSITFGFTLNLNVFSIAGLVIALIVYSRN